MKKNFLGKAGRKVLVGIFLAAWGMTVTTNSFADFSNYIKNNPDGSQILRGHTPSNEIAQATWKNHPRFYLNAQIIMPLSNQSQLSALLKCQYDPQCPGYHQWVNSTQFVQQFAPSVADVSQVQESLRPFGIYVTGQTGVVLNVTGASRSFERAFGVTINNYQKSDGTMFFAPDADPMIPAYLAGKILAIGGLDNLPKYKAHSHQSTPNAVSVPNASSSKALPKNTNGSGSAWGYLAPSDVKTAYNYPAASTANGSGQTVALFELDGYNPSDIVTYLSQFKLSTSNIGNPCNYTSSTPNTSVTFNNSGSCSSNIIQNILMDGTTGTPDWPSGGPYEVTLDIDLVAAFAPGSKNILVYEAPNTTQAWVDEWTQIATDNKAKVISCSWGEAEADSPTMAFDNQIFQQMAAQGQSVFVAAGDSGAYDAGGSTLAVDEPASQPYATGVGISNLTMNSSKGYVSEAASADGGGGISSVWSIPSYQLTLATAAVPAAKVSKTKRNVPDVALTADPNTSYAFYMSIPGSAGWYAFWGSSLASPIWASFISLVNQGLAANGPIGQVNPALYQLAQSSRDPVDFHDITSGNNGYYPAEPGFDDATGLGSFNGMNLYGDLLKITVASSVPSVPTGLSATAGTGQVSLSWNASPGAMYYNVKRSTTPTGTVTVIPVQYPGFTDSTVSGGVKYYYVVSAVNSDGQSANSAQVNATPAALAPPVGVKATAGYSQVSLSWNATGATYYDVKRSSVSGGPYAIIASNLLNNASPSYITTSFVDNTVTAGVTYFYVVSALNSPVDSAGQSANSAQVSATPLLAPPTGLKATAGNAQVTLSWTASAGAVSYNIYRGTSSGGENTTPIKNVTGTTVSYVDTGLSNGTNYYYFISAVNPYTSANSAQVSAIPVSAVASMAAPTNLTGTVTTYSGQPAVLLQWQKSASTITSYNIWYSTGTSTSYVDLGSVSSTAVTVYGLGKGVTYNFYVTAVNGNLQSTASNKVTIVG